MSTGPRDQFSKHPAFKLGYDCGRQDEEEHYEPIIAALEAQLRDKQEECERLKSEATDEWLAVGEWLRGESEATCATCEHVERTSDMEFGHYCKLGDESKVWDVQPWGACKFSPSRYDAAHQPEETP